MQLDSKAFGAKEFIYVLCIVLLLCVGVLLIHNIYINGRVKHMSRCKRDRDIGRRGGKFSVTATSAGNTPLFKTEYDLYARQSSLSCACPEGTVGNTFRNIPLYSLSTSTPTMVSEKNCACDREYAASSGQIYYNGWPGLVRYMNSDGKDTSFFDAAMAEASQ